MAAPLPDVTERYEALRRGALGAPIEPAARHGLTLLLRRGLWAWARVAVVAEPAAAPPSHPASTSPALLPQPRRDLACILAGMAMAHTSTASVPP